MGIWTRGALRSVSLEYSVTVKRISPYSNPSPGIHGEAPRGGLAFIEAPGQKAKDWRPKGDGMVVNVRHQQLGNN